MFTSRDEIEESLVEAGVNPKEARILAQQARPATRHIPHPVDNEESIPVGMTKIGGRPDLPEGVEWPWRSAYPEKASCMASFRERATRTVDDWRWGTLEQRIENCEEAKRDLYAVEHAFPLSFIAQINFAEMWGGELNECMPCEGVLYLFYDLIVQPWGCDPKENVGFSVLYIASDTKLIRREIPEQLLWLDCWSTMRPVNRCETEKKLSLLPYGTAQWELSRLSDETAGIVAGWRKALDDFPGSQISGWPDVMQDDMQVGCAFVSSGHVCDGDNIYTVVDSESIRATATEWILLAQFDSEDIGWMNCDWGRLYLWIKRSDLIARRFERAQLIQQCD